MVPTSYSHNFSFSHYPATNLTTSSLLPSPLTTIPFCYSKIVIGLAEFEMLREIVNKINVYKQWGTHSGALKVQVPAAMYLSPNWRSRI